MLFTKRKFAVPAIQETDMPTGVESLKTNLYFLQITRQDVERIKQLQPLFEEHAEEITKRHYDLLLTIPQMKELIDRHSSIEKLTVTFVRYIQSLGNPTFDQQYVDIRKRIGLTHSRIQLTPEWFVGTFTRIYEYMVPAIIARYGGSPETAELLLALNRLLTLDAQLAMEAYQEDLEFQHALTHSQIVEELIGIDKVKSLLDAVGTAIDEANSVASAAEQLSASEHEVADNAIRVAENTEQLVQVTEKGQAVIQRSLSGFMAVVEEFEETRSRLQELLQAIDNVTEIVQFIRGMAEQTNLLALNAAIEAARAGEEGRGFAVVAGEVRKLAEQTKSSVESITDMIEQVLGNASSLRAQTEQMASTIQKRVEETKEAYTSLDTIMNEVQEIGGLTGNIAAIVEEQTAATQDISERINQVLNMTEHIKMNALDTGRAIYDASVHVNELRQKSMVLFTHVNNSQLIRLVKTDHLLWRWWVYNTILGYHQADPNQVADHTQCRLGKWYLANKNNPHVSSLPSYQELDKPHEQIHQLAREAIQHIQSGGHKGMVYLRQIETLSQQIVGILDQLQQDLSRQY